MSDLFARVRPLIGDVLDSRVVAVIGSAAAGAVVELLVACGVRQWIVMVDNPWMEETLAKLCQRYGDAIDIHVARVNSVGDVAGADLALVVDDAVAAMQLPLSVARMVIFTPTRYRSAYGLVVLEGESLEIEEQVTDGLCASWDWLTAAPLMALQARALLLRDTEYRMVSWEDGWAKGLRMYDAGVEGDPTRVCWRLPSLRLEAENPTYRTTSKRQGTLLVAGLGSLGSVAAEQLARRVERLVLVDPDCVEVANLVRQGYAAHQVGMPKAIALVERYCAADPELVCEALVVELHSDQQVVELVERFSITGALVTTGSHADFAITRGLQAAGVPHVVGRCYARARFWEGIVVEASKGEVGTMPSYGEVRRAGALGPTPAPTPEEMAAYGAVGELVAEPATAMEIGWAAMWLGRLMEQVMTPPSLREGWFLARMAAGATCFVGGVVVEQAQEVDSVGDGNSARATAYGVRVPGEVHAWSVEEIG